MREREREREREGERERDEKERKCACNKRLQLAKAVLSLEIEAGNVEPIYEWEIICNYDNTSQQVIHSSTFELRCFDARLSYPIHSTRFIRLTTLGAY